MSDSGSKSEERLLKKIKKYQDRLSRRRRRYRKHHDSSDRSRSGLRSPDIVQENIDTQITIDTPIIDYNMSPEAIQNNNAQDLTGDTPPQQEPDLLEPYREVLGKDYEQPNKFEGMIQEDIARSWSYLLINGLTKSDRDDILKKHKVPLNCKLLEAPILNEEVKVVLTDSSKQRDKAIEAQQHQLGLATSIIGEVMSLMIKENNQAQISLFRSLTEASKLLIDLNQQQTNTRRILISPILDKSFNHIIHTVERDEYLYGMNLSEKIKATKQMLVSSIQIKKSTPKSASTSTITKVKTSGNRSGPPRQNFRQHPKAMARGGPRSRGALPQPSQRYQQPVSGHLRSERTSRGAYNRH